MLVDALKPRETSIMDLSRALCSVNGVEEVDAIVSEVDVKTETIKITIMGPNINYSDLTKVMDEYGVAVKGVDEVRIVKTKLSVRLPTET
jgi:hypothetical protein